ncbi:tol-pal system protein YbgF [bacterium]|nr:tol-pal system protein YbgF [bacterium]
MKTIRGIFWGAAITPLLALLFFGGCATRSEIQRFQWQVDSLSLTNQIQSRQLMRLDSLMTENVRLLRAIQASHSADMSALQEEMRIVESIMRDSGFKVNNLNDRIESLKDDIAARPPVEGDSLDVVGPRGDEVFSTALIDLNRGKFELAIMGFKSYLEKFPDGPRADDAQYNIGEAQLAKAEYPEAAMSYLTVTRKWPKSDLVPSALYKAARCYEKMDQVGMAKNYYKQLIERHSGAAEAELAKKRMQELER